VKQDDFCAFRFLRFIYSPEAFSLFIVSYLSSRTPLTHISHVFMCRIFSVFTIKSVSLGALPKLRKATISLIVCVCQSAWNSSVPTARIFTEFGTGVFYEKL
jgi:hypothetical protein